MTSTIAARGAAVTRNVRTGLLFLSGALLVGVLGIVISKNTGFGKSHRRARIFVADTKGLAIGNPVSIAGKKVGTVSELEFGSRHDTAGIVIILDVEGEAFGLIGRDANASIKGLGMLGDKYIDIMPGHARERLDDDGFLTAMSEPGMVEITANAVATSARLNEMLAETIEITRRINRGEGAIGALLNSTELTDDLAGTASNMRRLSATLASDDGVVHELFADRESAARLRSTLATIAESGERLRASMLNGEGTLGKLLTDESLYDNLSSLTRRADTLVATLNAQAHVLDGYSDQSEIYATMRRSVASLDSLFIDIKRRPARYVHFSVFN
jgi:phospholipid/cholesterol/gamma-HCH transport system substrate-binding protein